jgi:hypothetical protein
MSDLKVSMSCSTLGVDSTLGNTLTIEMGELVDQVEVLKKNGTSWTSGHGVLVVINWASG